MRAARRTTGEQIRWAAVAALAAASYTVTGCAGHSQAGAPPPRPALPSSPAAGARTPSPAAGVSSGSPAPPRSVSPPAPSASDSAPPAPPSASLSHPFRAELTTRLPATPAGWAATEAPNGTVFVADGTDVQAVEPTGAVSVAEHASGPVLALAADDTTLFVATSSSVTGYQRSTGTPTSRWDIAGAIIGIPATTSVILVAAGGQLWASVNFATDESGFEDATLLHLEPGGVVATLEREQVWPGELAAAPDGSVYFADADNHLDRVTAAGVSTRSAAAGFYPQSLVYDLGQLLVQGESSSAAVTPLQTVDAATLRVTTATTGPAGTYVGLAATTAGLLRLRQPCLAGYACPTAVLQRLELPTTAARLTQVPYAALLLGPRPAVVLTPPGRPSAVELF